MIAVAVIGQADSLHFTSLKLNLGSSRRRPRARPPRTNSNPTAMDLASQNLGPHIVRPMLVD